MAAEAEAEAEGRDGSATETAWGLLSTIGSGDEPGDGDDVGYGGGDGASVTVGARLSV